MANGVFKQSLPAANLSLERGTENVPDDGHLHLVVDGVVVGSFRSEKAALIEYQRLRRLYLDDHPVEVRKASLDDVIKEDQNRMSNKELIWGPEDFQRVDKMTRRRR